MIILRQSGDHQSLLTHLLLSLGYSPDTIKHLGVYNTSLISFFTPQMTEAYENKTVLETEFFIDLIKRKGVKAAAYFMQEWMDCYDPIDACRNKDTPCSVWVNNHFDQTKEALKDETYTIIAE